ncbi:MAG: type II toxin-antitoxin system RelE/ParE family toxin [Solirubrobacteraceae bacterium]
MHCSNASITLCRAAWNILFSSEAERWLASLIDTEWDAIMGSVELLEERGPALGRPAVDTIKGSRHRNMKELRSRGGNLRALFAFDPERRAIVLLGGDKTNDWQGWYDRNVPLADDLYDDYLDHLQEVS